MLRLEKTQVIKTETNCFHKIFCHETRFHDPEAFIRMGAPGCAEFCSSYHVLAVQYLCSIPHCIHVFLVLISSKPFTVP